MEAPGDFTLKKKSDSGRPPPSAPSCSKTKVYSDYGSFKYVDDHALAVAKVNYNTFRDLIWNLVFKKNFNKLEKARAIFRWLNFKDYYTYSFDEIPETSPEAVLQDFKEDTTTFARALECMASYAGLHCVVIGGWVKAGVSYEVGKPFTCNLSNHFWNAVYIDGSWRLMDSSRATSGNLVFDDFFFIPDPDQLIFSHFPEDRKWQLSSNFVTKDEFDQYPLTDTRFFKMGMKFLQQSQGIIFTHGGISTLTLGYTKPTSFIFKLEYGEERTETHEGIPIERYMLQETTDSRVTYYFRAPCNGDFFITVYAQKIPDSLVLDPYKIIVKFKIICDKAAPDTKPFPVFKNSAYGPDVIMLQYGLTSSERRGLLMTKDGKYRIVLKKTRDVKFVPELRNDAVSERKLKEAVSVEDIGIEATIRCNLKEQGEYGLVIFANDPKRHPDTFKSVCQYLISYTTQTLYGKVYEDFSSTELVRYNYSSVAYSALTADSQFSETPAKSSTSTSSASISPESSPITPPRRSRIRKSSQQQIYTCSVCFSDYDEIVDNGMGFMSTKCGHIFCEACIKDSVRRQGCCPICRTRLTKDDVHVLYF